MRLERILLDGNCAVGCGTGTDCVGWYLCCRVWVWNGFFWMVTVLKGLGLERIVLDGNSAVSCGSEMDCIGWDCAVGCGTGTVCVGW